MHIVKTLLRRLGILKQDELYHATRRHKKVIKAIRRRRGFQAANQAMDEADAMFAQKGRPDSYSAEEYVDDVTQFLKSKYLADA
jgi:hypothetical protein